MWILVMIMPLYFLNLFADETSKTLIIPLTVFVTMIIGFANKAGEILEDPFENRVHDVPMSALCQTIEKDLIEKDLPDGAVVSSKETVRQSSAVKEPVIW